MILENLKNITEEQMIHIANMFEQGDWKRTIPGEKYKWNGHDLIMSKDNKDYVFQIDYSDDFKMMSYADFSRFRLYENLTLVDIPSYKELKQIRDYLGFGIVDLRNCEPGDILLSTHGHTLEYVNNKPDYLDHNVLYITKDDGSAYPNNCIGTRTHDGYTYKKSRMPDVDQDIIKIIKLQYK